MNIYIAYDYNSTMLGILLAVDQKSAELVWMGMGVNANKVEEIDPSDNNIGIHGVVTLVTSTEYTKRDIEHKSHEYKFRICKRGT